MNLSKETFPLTVVEGKNIIASKTLVTALKLVPVLERVITKKGEVFQRFDDDGNLAFSLTWEQKEAFKRIATSEVAEMSSDYLEDTEGDRIIFTNSPLPQFQELGRMSRVETPTQAFVAKTLIEKYRKRV